MSRLDSDAMPREYSQSGATMSCLVRLAFGMVCRKTSMQGVVVAVIETSGLTKFYGDAPGIIDLELEVRQGEVFGFLGPNGAGKSTTIRLLFNFLMPTRGSASVLGLDMVKDSVEIRRRTGYLPGDLALYGHMTASMPGSRSTLDS